MSGNNHALGTKTRALYGKLIDNDQYSALVQTKNRREMLALLASYPAYSDMQVSGSASAVEAELYRIRRDNVNSIFYFAKRDEQEFLEAYQLTEELSELKDYLRVLLFTDHKTLFTFVEHSAHAEELHFSADPDTEVDAYLRTLVDRPYYRVIEPYLGDEIASLRKRNYTLELNLDRWYYDNLFKEMKDLPKSAQKDLKDYIGKKIDLINLQWLYRLKTYHADDAIVQQTVATDGGKQFKPSDLKELMDMNREAFLGWLNTTTYRGLIVDDKKRDYEWDLRSNRWRLQMLKSLFRKPQATIVSAIAYMELTQIEVINLTRILEGLDLKLPAADIRAFLILDGEKGGRI